MHAVTNTLFNEGVHFAGTVLMPRKTFQNTGVGNTGVSGSFNNNMLPKGKCCQYGDYIKLQIRDITRQTLARGHNRQEASAVSVRLPYDDRSGFTNNAATWLYHITKLT